MKKCNKCNISKNLDLFSLNKSGKFGRHSICKECRQHKYSKVGYIEKTKRKQQYKVDPNKFLQANKKWYDKNKEEALKVKRIYYKFNSESFKVRASKRRVQKISASLFGYDKEITTIYKKAKELELLDGIKREVHHIIPLQELDYVSGLHVPWNLEILTKEEHLEKHRELRIK